MYLDGIYTNDGLMSNSLVVASGVGVELVSCAIATNA